MPGQTIATGGGTPDNDSVTTAKIQDGAVALADMANLATDKIIGRVTAATGVPEAVTFTDAAQALCDDASADAQRTTLGVGTGDSPQFTGINVGHATDTTITRVSAGVIAVEGVQIATGTGTASGTNTGDQTLPTRASLGLDTTDSPMFTGLEIGHATDTTLTRVSAGVVAVEGVQLATGTGTASGTNTGDQTLPTRASLGLDTTDSPMFTGINLGHASDTTLARSGAGDATIEGNALYRAGGTDVPVADGGTGASDAATARVNLGITSGRDVFRRFLFASKSPIDAATFTAYGFTAPTFTGVAVRVRDADGDWVRCTNSGAGGGLVNKSDCLIETRHHPVFTIRVKTGSALPAATERIFVGLSSGDPMGADDPGAVHCLLFRYAPTSDATAFWRVVTNDAGAAENVVVTSVVIAVNTVYEMKIDATDPASILFYINDTLAATVATDLPTISQALNITSAVKDSAGDKQWFNSNYTVEMD